MSVSRLSHGVHPMTGHGPGPEVDMPPFWELEDLIALGIGRETALALMALRRPEACAAPFAPHSVGVVPCYGPVVEAALSGPEAEGALLAEPRRA